VTCYQLLQNARLLSSPTLAQKNHVTDKISDVMGFMYGNDGEQSL